MRHATSNPSPGALQVVDVRVIPTASFFWVLRFTMPIGDRGSIPFYGEFFSPRGAFPSNHNCHVPKVEWTRELSLRPPGAVERPFLLLGEVHMRTLRQHRTLLCQPSPGTLSPIIPFPTMRMLFVTAVRLPSLLPRPPFSPSTDGRSARLISGRCRRRSHGSTPIPFRAASRFSPGLSFKVSAGFRHAPIGRYLLLQVASIFLRDRDCPGVPAYCDFSLCGSLRMSEIRRAPTITIGRAFYSRSKSALSRSAVYPLLFFCKIFLYITELHPFFRRLKILIFHRRFTFTTYTPSLVM